MIPESPIDLFRFVLASRVVYGPGRGLGHKGRFLVTRGPGKLGHPGPLSFHCSSWTNFVLAIFTGCTPEEFTHQGNMPSLFKLCEAARQFVWNPQDKGGQPLLTRPLTIRAYGDHCTRLPASSYRDLVENDLYGHDLVVLGESTFARGRWKWWHHTAALTRDEEGRIVRCAADGYRGRSGYSHTPMDLEVCDDLFVRRTDGKKRVRAYGVRWTAPTHHVDLEA